MVLFCEIIEGKENFKSDTRPEIEWWNNSLKDQLSRFSRMEMAERKGILISYERSVPFKKIGRNPYQFTVGPRVAGCKSMK